MRHVIAILVIAAVLGAGRVEAATDALIAFERNGDLLAARTDGSGVRNLTRTPNVKE